MAISHVIQESLYLRMLQKEMGIDVEEGGIMLLVGSQSSIKLAKNSLFHWRSKQIAIRHYFMRERIEMGDIDLEFARTVSMEAD